MNFTECFKREFTLILGMMKDILLVYIGATLIALVWNLVAVDIFGEYIEAVISCGYIGINFVLFLLSINRVKKAYIKGFDDMSSRPKSIKARTAYRAKYLAGFVWGFIVGNMLPFYMVIYSIFDQVKNVSGDLVGVSASGEFSNILRTVPQLEIAIVIIDFLMVLAIYTVAHIEKAVGCMPIASFVLLAIALLVILLLTQSFLLVFHFSFLSFVIKAIITFLVIVLFNSYHVGVLKNEWGLQ